MIVSCPSGRCHLRFGLVDQTPYRSRPDEAFKGIV
jgi:hypothetical protein